jgi:hypothetical protein
VATSEELARKVKDSSGREEFRSQVYIVESDCVRPCFRCEGGGAGLEGAERVMISDKQSYHSIFEACPCWAHLQESNLLSLQPPRLRDQSSFRFSN